MRVSESESNGRVSDRAKQSTLQGGVRKRKGIDRTLRTMDRRPS